MHPNRYEGMVSSNGDRCISLQCLFGNLHGCCWHPDESVCASRQFQRLDWVKKQRKIAKRHGSIDGYFTVEMLEGIKQVRRGIRGVAPDGAPQPTSLGDRRQI